MTLADYARELAIATGGKVLFVTAFVGAVRTGAGDIVRLVSPLVVNWREQNAQLIQAA